MNLLARDLEMEYSGMVAASRQQTEKILVAELHPSLALMKKLMLRDRMKQLSAGRSRNLFLTGFGWLSRYCYEGVYLWADT